MDREACVLQSMRLQSRTRLTGWTELNWFWERLRMGGEGDSRGWDGWMASLTQWTWVWASSVGDGEGQGSLVCCSPWGRKESDMTEWLNNKCKFMDYFLKSLNTPSCSVSWIIKYWFYYFYHNFPVKRMSCQLFLQDKLWELDQKLARFLKLLINIQSMHALNFYLILIKISIFACFITIRLLKAYFNF